MIGPLQLVTAPTAWPVSVDEAREQCRIDDDKQDRWLARAIRAATRYCERNIDGGRQLMTATWDLPLTGFWDYPLRLPKPPLQSVTSVKYYDLDAVQQTASSSLYVVRTPETLPGEIELLPDQIWPVSYDDRRYPVTVRFVAGYASAALVPETIRDAILLIVEHRNSHRGDDNEPLPMAVQSLLDSESWGAYA